MINQYLTVFVTSIMPISELRGAIPIGIAAFNLNPWLVYAVAVIGNILPIFFLLWFWEKVALQLAERYAPVGKFLHWLFERTRKKFYAKHKRWGQWALVIFVAIPLPITGAWTGSVAAWLFGIPYRRAISLIFLGILVSGIVVTLLTIGIINVV